jgi:phosphate transport system substrate-binding protein
MKKQIVPFYLKAIALAFLTTAVFLACKENAEKAPKETILTGNIDVYVDQTVRSLVQGQIDVFENQYDAKIALIAKSEAEIVNDLMSGKTEMAVLTRRLSDAEENYFKNKKIVPRISHFASDAVVFIRNKSNSDTLLDLDQVYNLLHEKPSTIKSLIFENPNSSVVSYMNRWANVPNGVKKDIFTLNSTIEVLEFISKNPDAIGVIGMDAVVEPYPEWQALLDNTTVMAVKNVKNGINNEKYYLPNQANLGAALYPLKRSIYVLNCQGFAGLGTGFASFIVGDIGQRIVLKSKLLPIKIPERNIIIRKDLNKK